MRIPIPEIEPVIIALESIDATGDVRFSGVDLESGARVVVSVDRRPADHARAAASYQASGLVLVLTIEAITKHQ
jgi:hypothetical protein